MSEIEKAIEAAERATPRDIQRSRLLLLGFFAGVAVLAAIVFLSDTSSFELKDPPNAQLVALARHYNAEFEAWESDDDQIAFTFSILLSSETADLTAEALEADLYAQAERLGLEGLRITSIVRFSASYKVSGFAPITDPVTE